MALGAGLSARLAAAPGPRLRAGGVARVGRPAVTVVQPVASRYGGSGSHAAWRGRAAGGRAASATQSDAPSSRPLDSVVASSASAPPPPPAPPAENCETLGAFAHDMLERRLRKANKLQKKALRQVCAGCSHPRLGDADDAALFPTRADRAGVLGRGHRPRRSRGAAEAAQHTHVRSAARGKRNATRAPKLFGGTRRSLPALTQRVPRAPGAWRRRSCCPLRAPPSSSRRRCARSA